MCGIIGRVGSGNSIDFLLEGLERLEYRGYDSAGIAVLENGENIHVVKCKGRIKELCEKVYSEDIKGGLGIGHTRWATHGIVSEENAHPHLSFDKKFAVVHNGIIENSDELYQKYLSDISPRSDTDTEVIPHLLSKFYKGNAVEAISKVISLLKGSYALGILCADTKDVLYCTAHSSPLVAAISDNGCFISSDVGAIADKNIEALTISDGNIAVVSENGISLFDKNGKKKSYDTKKVDNESYSNEKREYDHFMLLEIMEQPETVRNTLNFFIKNGDINLNFEKLTSKEFCEIENISIIACGSAYHAGLVGKKVIESLCKIPCNVEIASEFRYSTPMINGKTLAVFISQSGETADTLAALRLSKELGAKILSIVNVKGSAIANESDNVLYTKAGREVAVATTKAYSCQLAVLYLLAVYFANTRSTISKDEYNKLLKEVSNLPLKIQHSIDSNIEIMKSHASSLKTVKDMYFIGRQLDYCVAAEASLKMKEISYVHSEAYAAGELKHGTISLIEEGTPVVVIASDEDVYQKTLSNLREVASRGAKTLLITNKKTDEISKDCDITIFVPETNKLFSASVLMPPLQLFSYYSALIRGCDIDKPKNLAKSVTVE